MLPLRLRNPSEFGSAKAQQQYSPFRRTAFDPKVHDGKQSEGSRAGPGALFRDEWNSVALSARRKAPTLYTTDRDVNSTVTASVQSFYDAHEAHDLAAQLKKRGNAVTTLKSATPRFREIGESAGPGAYSLEKYHGAFPTLLKRASPAAAATECQAARASFDAEFPVEISSKAPLRLAPPHRRPLKTPSCSRHEAAPMTNNPPLQSARLVPELTPRTAYSAANRGLLLGNADH